MGVYYHHFYLDLIFVI